MHSIKTKLIVAISLLILFLFSAAGYLLVDEKKKEITHDIYLNARSFTELTTPKIVDAYEALLSETSFLIFRREINGLFQKNEDIRRMELASFSGSLLYDSEQENLRAYEGKPRHISDRELASRIKSSLPSYLLETGRLVYLKRTYEGEYLAVDENEKQMVPIGDTDQIVDIVVPYQGKYAAIFEVGYDNLRLRLLHTTQDILSLVIFGIVVGLGVAWAFSERITQPIEKLKEGALILAKGDFKARVEVKSKDEVGTLAETFNKMAADLEVATKAMIEEERLKKEIEVAARIQKEILPKTYPAIPGLQISANVYPALEVGGDCYDFIQPDPETTIFYIGDVTGHGVPSGIVASIANALIYSFSASPTLKDLLVNTNRVMKAKTAKNMFMTLLMLRYKTGKLDYISAGHPFMAHYRAADKSVNMEKGGGIALGMVPDVSKILVEASADFAPGDCIILYSDGIPEAASPSGEMYGLDRLKASLVRHAENPTADAVRDGFIKDVMDFMNGAEQLDDITAVVIRRTKA